MSNPTSTDQRVPRFTTVTFIGLNRYSGNTVYGPSRLKYCDTGFFTYISLLCHMCVNQLKRGSLRYEGNSASSRFNSG